MAQKLNPVATAEQAEHELQAVELMKHPVLQKTMAEVRARWLEQVNPPPDQRARFDASFEEVMYCAVVWSLNQDPQRPKVICITRLEHEVNGVRIPGSRYGLDNPDSVYRVIPIDGAERYVIRGKVSEPRLTENYFTLWDPVMNTVDVFSGHDIDHAPDGTFEITVNSDSKEGRRNHIQSSPKAHEFYIRDVIMNWSKDSPNWLTIEKLGPAKGAPKTLDEQVELAAKFMRNYAENTPRWNNQALQKPVNSFAFTIDRDTDGALRNQIYVMGHFKLADDEALVINVNLGGAKYFIAPITNWWGCTNEIIDRTGSLNRSQLVPNADGTLTIVLSLTDPGVHNWLDPSDMHEGILTLRWAEFPTGRPGPELSASGTLVKTAGLKAALPADTKWVTPAERQAQLAERARGYRRRLNDE